MLLEAVNDGHEFTQWELQNILVKSKMTFYYLVY
jgi:hypothetical protein